MVSVHPSMLVARYGAASSELETLSQFLSFRVGRITHSQRTTRQVAGQKCFITYLLIPPLERRARVMYITLKAVGTLGTFMRHCYIPPPLSFTDKTNGSWVSSDGMGSSTYPLLVPLVRKKLNEASSSCKTPTCGLISYSEDECHSCHPRFAPRWRPPRVLAVESS